MSVKLYTLEEMEEMSQECIAAIEEYLHPYDIVASEAVISQSRIFEQDKRVQARTGKSGPEYLGTYKLGEAHKIIVLASAEKKISNKNTLILAKSDGFFLERLKTWNFSIQNEKIIKVDNYSIFHRVRDFFFLSWNRIWSRI